MIRLVTIAASLMAPAADPAAFLPASGKWTIEYEPDGCTLYRAFGGAARPTTIAFQPNPLEAPSAAMPTFSLILPEASPAPRRGDATVTIEPSGAHFAATYASGPALGGLTLVTIRPRNLPQEAIDAMTRISIEAKGLPAVRLATQATGATAAALEACRRSLVTSWKIDPDEPSKIATPATPVANGGEWIRVGDYPKSAIKARASGVSTIRWTVGRDGRSTDGIVTRSSGNQDLDVASCAAIQQRGRYEPALGLDGKPMVSHKTRKVTWSLPS